MNDFFKLYRSILDHWIYEDSDYLKIWITMLCRARYVQEPKTGLYQQIQYTLNYGQFIFGRVQWSKDLGIGEQKIRTFINKLIKDNMLVLVNKSSKFTVYEIANYSKFNQQDNQQETKEYKGLQQYDNQQNNQQITITQPADNQQITTNKESNKDKKDKNDKEIKITSFDKTVNSYTENEELRKTIHEFNKMRKTIKKPMTDKALSLLLGNLDKLGDSDNTKIAILNQSIVNCWQGVFELKNRGGGEKSGNNRTDYTAGPSKETLRLEALGGKTKIEDIKCDF